jgi:hypothetical protein
MGTFTEGEPEVLTGVSWISETPEVATVSTSGLITPVSPGQTSITATKGSISQNVTLTVTAAELVELRYSGGRSLRVGEYTDIRQWSITGVYTDGTHKKIDRDLVFASSREDIAEFRSAGGEPRLYAISAGTTEIHIKTIFAEVSDTFTFIVIP